MPHATTDRNASELRAAPRFLIGAWTLVECIEILSDGSTRHPLGDDALGQVVYTADGRMSAQLVRAGRPMFPSDDYRGAPVKIAAEAFQNYFGYFGRYEVDADAGTVTHFVEGAWLPNLENTVQIRTFRLEEERLVLEATTPWGVIRNVWMRATGRS